MSHLTFEERCQIYVLKQSGMCQTAIAIDLKRHPSTIAATQASVVTGISRLMIWRQPDEAQHIQVPIR